MRRSRAHQLAEQFRVKRQRAEGEEQAQKKRAVIIALLPFYLNKVRVENRKPNRPVLNVDWETRRDALTDFEFTRRYRLNKGEFANQLAKILARYPEYQCEGPTAVSPELKLASALRWLAGGAYVDAADVHGQRQATFFVHLWDTLEKLNAVENVHFPLDDAEKLDVLSAEFSAGAGGGAWVGSIGALDGVVFKTQKPKWYEVKNVRDFYCARKHKWGINVQAICSRKCIFLWYSVNAGAAIHDSTAFNATALGRRMAGGEGIPTPYHVLGDAAYPASNCLMTPIPGQHGSPTPEDTFNFFQSSKRMAIERAFGILVKRWGVFSRALQCSLEHSILVIEVCFKLHNVCMLRAGEIERQESAGRFGHVDIATGGQQLSDEEIAEMLSFSEDLRDVDMNIQHAARNWLMESLQRGNCRRPERA